MCVMRVHVCVLCVYMCGPGIDAACKDGDHRLSRQQDLQLIALYVSELAALLAHRQPA